MYRSEAPGTKARAASEAAAGKFVLKPLSTRARRKGGKPRGQREARTNPASTDQEKAPGKGRFSGKKAAAKPLPARTRADWKLFEALELEAAKRLTALGDLMCFYNRVTEPGYGGYGWTAADVLRLAEIRAMLMPYMRTVI